MNLYRLFNKPVSAGMAAGGGATPPPREGVFVMPESLASFAGAAGAASGVWAAARSLGGAWMQTNYCALTIAALFGAAILFVALSDPQAKTMNRRAIVIQVIVALINTLVLYEVMIGVRAT